MPIDLRSLFVSLQQQLEVHLQTERRVSTHPGAKGDSAELNWKALLDDHLPSRYRVAKGFVIDSHGGVSDEIDLVVYDRQYSPLLFNRDGVLYVPAESVYAVLEVKQQLDKGTVDYAGRKAASVRALTRTSVPVPHAGGVYEPRALFRIIAGVVALESSWNPPMGEPLVRVLGGAKAEARLDIVCALRHGAWDLQYGDDCHIKVNASAADAGLVFFLLRLLARLQSVGTAPAIDLAAYGSSLEGNGP
jgi:hypothetical protein